MLSCLGCDVKQFNPGSYTHDFEFRTTIPAVKEFRTYQVVYDRANNGFTIYRAHFFDGNMLGNVSHTDDVTPTGDASTGDFSFTLSGVSTAKAGVYEFYGAKLQLLSCVKLYILGKPGAPVLSSGSIPEIGGSLTFTCSSSSTTFPSDHGLSLTYSWSVNSETNPSDSRYTYSSNTMRISNVQITDKDKLVWCTSIEHVNGGNTSDKSNQLAINANLKGVKLSITPQNSVTLNSAVIPSDATRTFSCGIINVNPADIRTINALRISRMTKHELKDPRITRPVTIALVIQDQEVERPYIPDIQDRNRVPDDGITGTINKVDFRQSQISIKFNKVAMQCDDAGQYFCQLSYLDKQYNSHSEEDSKNFTALALPSSVELTAKVNGHNQNSTDIDPAIMNEAEAIELTCHGNIGGDPNTQLEWKKSGLAGRLIKFQPIAYPNAVETREAVAPRPDECTNRRTTKLKYNITSNDRNISSIHFQCYVKFQEQGKSEPTQIKSTILYIQIISITTTENRVTSNTETSDMENSDTGAAVAGAIAGVIAVIIVVLAVLFILRKYKGLPILKSLSKRTNQASSYANVQETANINLQTLPQVMAVQGQTAEDGSRTAQYEILDPQRGSPAPYETLRTSNQCGSPRSGTAQYETLDQHRGSRLPYETLST